MNKIIYFGNQMSMLIRSRDVAFSWEKKIRNFEEIYEYSKFWSAILNN